MTKRISLRLLTISKTGRILETVTVLLAANLGGTYPGNISGVLHYDSGVPCGPKPIIKNDSVNRDFLTSALSTSAVVVFFEGVDRSIPWARN